MNQTAPPTASDAPTCSPFVFLDMNCEPWLVYDGWLHSWNRGAEVWVTARELRPGEINEMEKLKMSQKFAAVYGPPCAENS